MNPAVGPFAVAALLLTLGGVLKAARPGDTANALRTAGLPAGPLLVRAGGLAEAGIGGYGLIAADRISAILVAASYLAFAAFVGIALRRGLPIATCGCFGRADTPPSLVHVGVNLGAVAAAVAIAVDPGSGLGAVVRDQPLGGVPYVLLVVTGTYLAFLALTVLPRALELVRVSRGADAG